MADGVVTGSIGEGHATAFRGDWGAAAEGVARYGMLMPCAFASRAKSSGYENPPCKYT
jgi:hypothetical protein